MVSPIAIPKTGPLTGVFTASGVTAPFYAGIDATGPIPTFSVYLVFGFGATGLVTLTVSTDGGSTFAPLTDQGVAVKSMSHIGMTWTPLVLQGDGALYRLECSITGRGPNNDGVVHYVVGNSAATPVSLPWSDPPTYYPPGFCTAAQAQKLRDIIRTPLTDAAIAGDLIAYKACSYGVVAADGSYTFAGNCIAKLSIPAAAKRARANASVVGFYRPVVGFDRCIRAEYTDVVSVVKEDGTAVSVGFSQIDPPAKGYPGTVYTPGSRVVSRDISSGPKIGGLPAARDGLPASVGAFTDTTFFAGIACYATLIEAAALWVGNPPFSLTALGV